MKKNMLSILILALLIVNIVLTAIMMFSVTGTAKKTSALIDDISAAINLDLKNQSAATTTAPIVDVSIENTQVVPLGEEMTIPLTIGADGKQHYYLVAVSLSLNMKHEDYKKLSPQVTTQADLIKGEIINVIGSHTLEEIQEGTDSIRMEILQKLQTLFDSQFIFNVTFTKGLTQ